MSQWACEREGRGGAPVAEARDPALARIGIGEDALERLLDVHPGARRAGEGDVRELLLHVPRHDGRPVGAVLRRYVVRSVAQAGLHCASADEARGDGGTYRLVGAEDAEEPHGTRDGDVVEVEEVQ